MSVWVCRVQTTVLLHAVIYPAAKTTAASAVAAAGFNFSGCRAVPADEGCVNPITVCLSCSQNRPLKVGPQSKAQNQTLVMFEGCNCSSRVMFLFSLWPLWINSRSHLTLGLACQSPERKNKWHAVKGDTFVPPPPQKAGRTLCHFPLSFLP